MNTFRLRSLSFTLVLVAVLGLSGLAAAAGSCYGPDMTKLSQEKQVIVGKLYEDFHSSTEATRRELIAKRHELSAYMYASNPDEGKIHALAGEVSALRAKLYNARIALQSRLIQEGVMFGHGGGFGHGSGFGRGMKRGFGSCCCVPGSGMRGGL